MMGFLYLVWWVTDSLVYALLVDALSGSKNVKGDTKVENNWTVFVHGMKCWTLGVNRWLEIGRRRWRMVLYCSLGVENNTFYLLSPYCMNNVSTSFNNGPDGCWRVLIRRWTHASVGQQQWHGCVVVARLRLGRVFWCCVEGELLSDVVGGRRLG